MAVEFYGGLNVNNHCQLSVHHGACLRVVAFCCQFVFLYCLDNINDRLSTTNFVVDFVCEFCVNHYNGSCDGQHTGGRSRAARVGPRPCRHHEVLSGWGFRQPNSPTPKIYFLLGFRPLNLENVENQNVINACPFYMDCAIFISQFREFRLQCTVQWSCVFSHFNVNTTYVQVLQILRPTKRIYFIWRNNVMNMCITYLPRDPRTEPNRAESLQLSRAGPKLKYRTEQRRVGSQDHSS